MSQRISKRVLSVVLSVAMGLYMCAPAAAALAESRAVEVQNHTQAGESATISNVRIDGVDAPRAGAPLDDAARATADPGAAWDIPVLWVSQQQANYSEAQQPESTEAQQTAKQESSMVASDGGSAPCLGKEGVQDES